MLSGNDADILREPTKTPIKEEEKPQLVLPLIPPHLRGFPFRLPPLERHEARH